MEDDPYTILGISNEANWDTVRQAYRQELLKHHPDKHLHESAEVQAYHAEQCKKIIIAFKVLQEQHQGAQNAREPWEDIQYWKNLWGTVEKTLTKQSVKTILKEVMFSWIDTKYHKIAIKVSLEEIHQSAQKRVRIRFAECQESMDPILLSCESVCQSEGIQKLAVVAPDGKDIYIEWQVQEHPQYSFEGYDLIYEQSITLLDYIEGNKFTIETLDHHFIVFEVEPFRDLEKPIQIGKEGLCHKGDLLIYLKLALPKSKTPLNNDDWTNFKRILENWHHNQL